MLTATCAPKSVGILDKHRSGEYEAAEDALLVSRIGLFIYFLLSIYLSIYLSRYLSIHPSRDADLGGEGAAPVDEAGAAELEVRLPRPHPGHHTRQVRVCGEPAYNVAQDVRRLSQPVSSTSSRERYVLTIVDSWTILYPPRMTVNQR